MNQTPEERAREAVTDTMWLGAPTATCKAEDEGAWYETIRAEHGAELDAYRDAVRRAALAEVRAAIVRRFNSLEWAAAYPEDIWPETPFTDAQAASVLRTMLPHIKADILTTLENTP